MCILEFSSSELSKITVYSLKTENYQYNIIAFVQLKMKFKKMQEKNLNKDLYKFICKYKDLCKTGMWLAAKKKGGNQISWGSALISVLTILTLADRRLVYLMFGTGEELGKEVHDGIPSQVLGTHHHMVVLAGLSGVVLSPGLLPLHPDGTDAFNLVNNNTTNNNTLYFFHIPNRTPTLYWI